ncbi:MAG: lactam utilization protein LamB [Flavobacteriales bacterium]|nr:lactam utilization protein LamB [Flavobacteriales bacterium]|tara:strand:+ start:1232 stop:1960 length:729 start_codon:yes stop_codon:yes gene_type:complete
MRKYVDINVDVGEGFGNELNIVPFVSSINLACGGHAGDELTIQSVLELAKKYRVRVGAHPGFEDRDNFGRVPLDISIDELRESIRKQMDLIQFLAHQNGVSLSYIKPHGALYHMVCNVGKYALLLTEFAQEGMGLMGLPKSVLENVCIEQGIDFIAEGFADRVYETDGNLRKRSLKGSIHSSFDNLMAQVINLCNDKVSVFSNDLIELKVDSICFHGDHNNSGELIKKVVAELKKEGVEIRS